MHLITPFSSLEIRGAAVKSEGFVKEVVHGMSHPITWLLGFRAGWTKSVFPGDIVAFYQLKFPFVVFQRIRKKLGRAAEEELALVIDGLNEIIGAKI